MIELSLNCSDVVALGILIHSVRLPRTVRSNNPRQAHSFGSSFDVSPDSLSSTMRINSLSSFKYIHLPRLSSQLSEEVAPEIDAL